VEKNRLQGLYLLTGVVAFILLNFPIAHYFMHKSIGNIPLILIYFMSVGLLLVVVGFVLSRKMDN
jgi:hypothetical protein